MNHTRDISEDLNKPAAQAHAKLQECLRCVSVVHPVSAALMETLVAADAGRGAMSETASRYDRSWCASSCTLTALSGQPAIVQGGWAALPEDLLDVLLLWGDVEGGAENALLHALIDGRQHALSPERRLRAAQSVQRLKNGAAT